MKILFITDLHGHFDALALLPKADLVLVGGDFTTFGTLEEFQVAVMKVEGYFPNFRGVAGNLDPGLPSDQILKDSGHLLAQQMIQCNGVNLLGISGSNLCPGQRRTSGMTNSGGRVWIRCRGGMSISWSLTHRHTASARMSFQMGCMSAVRLFAVLRRC